MQVKKSSWSTHSFIERSRKWQTTQTLCFDNPFERTSSNKRRTQITEINIGIESKREFKAKKQTNLPLEYFGAFRQMFLLPGGRL